MIQNVVNYDILSNVRYADMFFYDARDRQVYSAFSDIVVQILYKGEDHSEEVEEDPEALDLKMFGE